MVVLFVALVFVLFISIDLMQERRHRAALVREGQTLHDRIRESEPHFVAGYELPPEMSFHKGHTWVHWVSPDQAYIGVDDFARRLAGHPDKVELPAVGAWMEQGKRAIGIKREGDVAHLASPISGEIIAVNPRIKADPDMLHRDNYGHGWLYKVRSPRIAEQLQNLLDGSLAARWMEDTRDRFQHQLTLATGSVIQDGGTTVDDVASHLEHDAWRRLVDEFLEPRQPRA